jgi:hypothetical protein
MTPVLKWTLALGGVLLVLLLGVRSCSGPPGGVPPARGVQR